MNPLLRSGDVSGGGSGVSVFERQQEHYQHLHNIFMQLPEPPHLIADHAGGRNLDVKPDVGWPEFGSGGGYGDQMGYGYMSQNTVLKMTSCNPAPADQSFQYGNSNSASVSVSVSPKKRKADKGQSLKVASEKDKKIKVCVEEEDSKITHSQSNNNNNSKETSADTSSKEKSKVSEVQKPDYIHVRARRGQATDSHSLAERVRREKISERMKYLQDLVPGCNKITGKAGMLDEIINYVQSLQKQVEFLSMKLATVNPELDFNIDNIFTKETSTSEFPALGCSSETYFQLNSLEQVVSYCGLEMGLNPAEMVLRRSISAPVSAPETFVDSSYFNQIQPSATWDADLQNLYKMEFQQGTLMPFQSHQFTGSNEGSNLKMEM